MKSFRFASFATDALLIEQLVSEMSPHHEHIWLVIDGLYSMFGDFAPATGTRISYLAAIPT